MVIEMTHWIFRQVLKLLLFLLNAALIVFVTLILAGAFAAQFTIPTASTWVFPSGGGTLALATGGETGTQYYFLSLDGIFQHSDKVII